MAKERKKTVKQAQSAKKREAVYFPQTTRKSISVTRSDIATWNAAIKQAGGAQEPKRTKLMRLYDSIVLDSLLSSQIAGRKLQTVSAAFKLMNEAGKPDEEAMLRLASMQCYADLVNCILDAEYYGCSLVELCINREGNPEAKLIQRENVVPDNGRFYPDADGSKFIEYRTMREYGVWLLEFNSGNFGILNKAVQHVLMKRFAQKKKAA
ncbi:MAG: hypothetical protein LBR10_12140 [Prevotellaceae bacterium]|jgi:hypothetical protein|nr:hypothetical protein [Prevotellaceae bacterium]